MTDRPIIGPTHGNYTDYNRGCRCPDCTRAKTVQSNTFAYRDSLATDCTETVGTWKGSTSTCIKLAGELTEANRQVARIARSANASEAAYARHGRLLDEAKANRDRIRTKRDDHMAVCPAAAIRFGDRT